MKNYIIPDWPAPANVRAYSTTRQIGNLADHIGDDRPQVAINRQKLMRDLKLPQEPIWLNQVHGNLAVDAANIQTPTMADASFTVEPKQVCTILTADCLPILLCDTKGIVVAAIHAGWR